MVTMPIEIFVTLVVSSFILALIGLIRQPQIPAMIVFGGMILLFLGATTTLIQMGNLVSSSTSSSGTTTYTYTADNFTFTQQVQLIFLIIAITLMLAGGLMQMREM